MSKAEPRVLGTVLTEFKTPRTEHQRIKNNNPKVKQSSWYLKIKLIGLQNKLSAANAAWAVTPLQMSQGTLLHLCKYSEVTVLISIISQDSTPALRSLSMQYSGRMCRNLPPPINAEKPPTIILSQEPVDFITHVTTLSKQPSNFFSFHKYKAPEGDHTPLPTARAHSIKCIWNNQR